MKSSYEKKSAAFPLVASFAIINNGQPVGTLAYKFPKDGAGRLTCFLHFHGYSMTTGYATGYGYDKKSAALEVAASHADLILVNDYTKKSAIDEFPVIKALQNIGGSDAYTVFKQNGFDLFQTI